MKLSKKTEEILAFLRKWQNEEHLYNLHMAHTMDFYAETEEETFLEGWWDTDLTQYFDEEFLVFANEGGAEYSAFWQYPELKSEHPIIMWPESGGEPMFLAGSINDAVCKMIHSLSFYSELSEPPTDKDLEKIYNFGSYDETNPNLSIEEIRTLLIKERAEFKARALQIIDFISEEEIEKNMKKHPNFVVRYSQYHLKSMEEYFFGTIKNEEKRFMKLINYLKKEFHSEYSEYNQEVMINALYKIYPKLTKTATFLDWLKNIDTPDPKPKLSKEDENNAILFAKYINEYVNDLVDEKTKTKLGFLESFKLKYPEKYKLDFFQKRFELLEKNNFETLVKSDFSIKDVFTILTDLMRLNIQNG